MLCQHKYNLSIGCWLHYRFNHFVGASPYCMYTIPTRWSFYITKRPLIVPFHLLPKILHSFCQCCLLICSLFSALLGIWWNLWSKRMSWCIMEAHLYSSIYSKHTYWPHEYTVPSDEVVRSPNIWYSQDHHTCRIKCWKLISMGDHNLLKVT